jgi:hypothetical protein
MPNRDDQYIYRSFEEFEREELRRADAVGSAVDELFEGMFTDELDFDAATVRRSRRDEADDEE